MKIIPYPPPPTPIRVIDYFCFRRFWFGAFIDFVRFSIYQNCLDGHTTTTTTSTSLFGAKMGSPEIPLNPSKRFLIADVFRVTKPSRSSPCRISLAPACQIMMHVPTNFRLNRDQCISKLAVACLDKSIYCFYGAIRQTNMATDSFNIYLSPVGVKSLNRFVINWQAGAKLIRHVRQYKGFVTLNASAIKKTS